MGLYNLCEQIGGEVFQKTTKVYMGGGCYRPVQNLSTCRKRTNSTISIKFCQSFFSTKKIQNSKFQDSQFSENFWL